MKKSNDIKMPIQRLEATRQNILFILNENADLEQIINECAKTCDLCVGISRDRREKDSSNEITEVQELADLKATHKED